MTSLSEASQSIGALTMVISAIASQTNLLALNATIEAARAGEAGHGFAVVAREVKDLALQTAIATNNVSDRVQAIQSAASAVSASVTGITETVRGISDIQIEISAALEQQATIAQRFRH